MSKRNPAEWALLIGLLNEGMIDGLAILAKGIVAVTCTDCLRTFPVLDVTTGVNTIQCEFCLCPIKLEIMGDNRAI